MKLLFYGPQRCTPPPGLGLEKIRKWLVGTIWWCIYKLMYFTAVCIYTTKWSTPAISLFFLGLNPVVVYIFGVRIFIIIMPTIRACPHLGAGCHIPRKYNSFLIPSHCVVMGRLLCCEAKLIRQTLRKKKKRYISIFIYSYIYIYRCIYIYIYEYIHGRAPYCTG